MGSKACVTRLQKEYRAILKVSWQLCVLAVPALLPLHGPSVRPAPVADYLAACPVALQEPVPHITAHPAPSNLLEWHYVSGARCDGQRTAGPASPRPTAAAAAHAGSSRRGLAAAGCGGAAPLD